MAEMIEASRNIILLEAGLFRIVNFRQIVKIFITSIKKKSFCVSFND